jgi:hypothetical protein
VKVESVAIGQRRSLLPGLRWARGRLPVDTFPPGTLRVDTIAPLRGESEHERVTKYVERFTEGGVVDARKVFEADVGDCPYRVWDVHATRGRWWVVAKNGVLPLTPYNQMYANPVKVIAARRALAQQLPGSC